MLFNTIDFAFFLPVALILYWSVHRYSVTWSNSVLLGLSYYFYSCWDHRFLVLILISSLVDFSSSWLLGRKAGPVARTALLCGALTVNLGILFYFKYFNFFIESFAASFSFFGKQIDSPALHIILPVGISFYTFQSLSYTIDVYRHKLLPCGNPIQYCTFVAFFPQLVAGPIERASHLLPQFLERKIFNYPAAVVGARLILLGLFKKVAIADNCAPFVDQVFQAGYTASAPELWLAALLFSAQIYCDFSGYSDIAIGVAALFGFSLHANFSYPYFAETIHEFWRRWHMSLTGWFRDYLYIPLGGNRGGRLIKYRNILIVFTVSGLWHGANWTFVVWGVYHGILIIIYDIYRKLQEANGTIQPKDHGRSVKLINSVVTFCAVCVGWVIFRSESLASAVDYLKRMFFFSDFGTLSGDFPEEIIALIFLLMLVEYLVKEFENLRVVKDVFRYRFVRWGCYYAAIGITLLQVKGAQEFIYFQF